MNAMFWNVSSLAACTASPPNELTVVPAPIDAVVVIVMTLIPAEPATPVCDPMATPRPCVEKSLTWRCAIDRRGHECGDAHARRR